MRIKLKPFSSQHLLCPPVTAYHHQSWLVHTKFVFSDKVRNLGFILISNFTMKQHVIKTCPTAYYELKRISSIRRYLTEDAAKQLVTSCVLSRLDYCNSLLTGTPNSVIQPMQKVQNTAAHLILRAPCHQNCTPLLQQLHWLPICEWIIYKTACRFCSILSFWATIPLQSFMLSPLFVRYMHAQTPTLQPQNPCFLHFFTLWPPHLEQSPPSGSLLLSLPSKANSRHFSSQNISAEQHCPSPLSVCTECVCVCVCVCTPFAKLCLNPCLHYVLPFFSFLIYIFIADNISILMYIYACSALWAIG